MVVLFDVDGVLVSAGHFGAWLESTYSLTNEDTGHFFRGPFKACSSGHADLLDVITPFLHDWGIEMSPEDVIAHWFRLDSEVMPAGVRLFEEVAGLGLTTGIATTQEKYRKQYLMENIGVIQRCDFHFISCDLGHVKPEPEYYQRISAQLDQQEVLFFDDIAANVRAAREAGWTAHHYQGETSLADFGIKI